MQKSVSYILAVLSVSAFTAVQSMVTHADAVALTSVVTQRSEDPLLLWRSDAKAALQRGQKWLVEQQRQDGSWSEAHFPALTALALWALTGSDDHAAQKAADRAVEFIVNCQQADGGIYIEIPGRKGGGLSTYNTAICMSGLQKTGRLDLRDTLLKARTFLASVQYRGEEELHVGGFGYDAQRDRPYTDINNTHFALEAMYLTRDLPDRPASSNAKTDIDWDSALRYVSSLQAGKEAGLHNAGGFIYNPIDPKAGTETNAMGHVVTKSYGSAAYVGMVALLCGGVTRDDPRLQALFNYCARNWSITDNPAMEQQGLYFYYVTMARGLYMSGLNTLADGESSPAIEWRKELACKLIELQKPDGFWLNENGRFSENDPVLVTAYSLIALQYILAP